MLPEAVWDTTLVCVFLKANRLFCHLWMACINPQQPYSFNAALINQKYQPLLVLCDCPLSYYCIQKAERMAEILSEAQAQ